MDFKETCFSATSSHDRYGPASSPTHPPIRKIGGAVGFAASAPRGRHLAGQSCSYVRLLQSDNGNLARTACYAPTLSSMPRVVPTESPAIPVCHSFIVAGLQLVLFKVAGNRKISPTKWRRNYPNSASYFSSLPILLVAGRRHRDSSYGHSSPDPNANSRLPATTLPLFAVNRPKKLSRGERNLAVEVETRQNTPHVKDFRP